MPRNEPRRTQKYSVEREIPLPRAAIWELLSNTEHLNRVIGLPPVQYGAIADDASGFREATARLAGQTLRWIEHPFEWVQNESHSVVREYSSGPFQRFHGGIELKDGAAGQDGVLSTRVRCFIDIVPAHALGALLTPVVARDLLRKSSAYCEAYLRLRTEAGTHVLPPTPAKINVNTTQLEHLLQSLAQQPVAPNHIALLGAYLRERADDEVAALRPYQLATQWNADPDEILRLCLYATKVGLLNLEWNLMCPNCRVSKSAVSALSKLTEQFHCDFCGVIYDANFDRSVELRFNVHPSVRAASNQIYCIAGPYVTPHRLVQRVIAKDNSVIISYPAASEALRLRVLRANHAVLMEGEEPGAEPLQLMYHDEGWQSGRVATPAVGTPIEITNRSASDIVVALEKVVADALAVTAAQVTAMHEFRDLFSSEVLAPGHHVGIENLTLFFSDLRDSTALYESAGDAPAYGRVRRHFDYLTEHITQNSGTIVKTIGDAVMAVFRSPEDALRAALDIQKHLGDFNATLPGGASVVIKIGLHHGPAIAINSNDRLDYFGRTVNIASRIEGISQGGDVVISDEFFRRETVQSLLGQYSVHAEPHQVSLKGIEGAVELYRLSLR